MFFIPGGSFRRFENCTVKVSARETKLTSLEVRTRPTFLEILISKYDFGPVKLPGLSRNRPQEPPDKANGDVLLDGVAFSRLELSFSIELLVWGRTFLDFLGKQILVRCDLG